MDTAIIVIIGIFIALTIWFIYVDPGYEDEEDLIQKENPSTLDDKSTVRGV